MIRNGSPSRRRRALPRHLAAGSGAAIAVAVAALAGGMPVTAAANGSLARAGTISTIVGGVGGPAGATSVAIGYDGGFTGPCGVSYGNGHLYIAAGLTVRKVNPATDWLTTPVGAGAQASLRNGVPADRAEVDTCAVAFDHSGNLVIADSTMDLVRVVAASTGTFYGQPMTAGHVYTVAGDGTAGYSGDGGPAVKALLRWTFGVAVDATGNLVIADSLNARVRVVAARTGTFYGQPMTAGDIYTVAGDGTPGYSGDGGRAIKAELAPYGVAVDAAGNLVIADQAGDRVRVVAASTGTFYRQKMTSGDIYTIAGDGTLGFGGDGGPATSAELNGPRGVHVDSAGNIVVADLVNGRVRVVAASTGSFYGQAMTAGDIYTVAGDGDRRFGGDGGPATAASLSPNGVTEDGAGNLVIADWTNNRVRVVAASSGTFYGRAMTAGDIYTVAGNGAVTYSGDGGPAAAAELSLAVNSFPDGLALDHAGNLLIADQGNNVVRVVAASSGTFYGQAMAAGDIYTIAGDGTLGSGSDGVPATATKLSLPMGLAVDKAGNVLIADWGTNRVRVVAASSGSFYGRKMTAGDIYTVAGDGTAGSAGNGGPAAKAQLNEPTGLTVDHAGNLVIAEWASNWVQVVAKSSGTFYHRKMTAGHIYAVAGDGIGGFAGDKGPATKARLTGPSGVAVDRAGNLVIADWYNNRLRVVAARTGTFYGQKMTAGDIYTIAGDGPGGHLGDNGPATKAAIDPESVTLDAAGNLVIADAGDNRVRVVAVRNGTFYGRKMTAGDIYTVAGNGTFGFAGDGGPARKAELAQPTGVLVTSAGNLLIADENNGRVRMVTS